LLPSDMVSNPDELSNMTYISYYRDYERKRSQDLEEEEKLKIPVANNCVAYGPGLEGGESLVPTYFTIETRNYKNQPIPIDHNPYEVVIQGPNGQVPVTVEPDETSGKFIARYTPSREGNHKINVTLKNQNINRSPFNVRIEGANADPNNSKVWGSGIEDGDTGKEKEVFIQPKNSIGENLNLNNLPFDVVVQGPYGTVPVDLKKRDDGVYVGKYNPEDPGQYQVDVNLGQNPVANSPYKITIDRPLDESDPTKTWAEGPGLEPGNKNTKSTNFTIHSVDRLGQPRREGGDLFDVYIEDPSFNIIDPKITDNGDGTYSVEYHPTTAGKYHIDVVQRNKGKPLFYDHISNSPIDVIIEPGIDPSKCIAFGPGLEDGVVDTRPTSFTIQSKDSNGNNLTEGGDPFEVLINGPDGDMKPEVVDNNNGTYTVNYQPDTSGEHKVNVLLDKVPIGGSPFTVNVKAGADYSSSFVEKFTFLIRTRDRRGNNRTIGGDNVTCTITDPNNKPLKDVELKDVGDGTYLVIYSLPEDYVPGEYLISSQIDGRDIKGSPWKQLFN